LQGLGIINNLKAHPKLRVIWITAVRADLVMDYIAIVILGSKLMI
jgi:hypothetical protein